MLSSLVGFQEAALLSLFCLLAVTEHGTDTMHTIVFTEPVGRGEQID